MNETHAASLLYVHPHPTAARRAATLASSGREMHMGARTSLDRFRGVLRHEKSPRGTYEVPQRAYNILERKIQRPISLSRLLL